MYVFVNANGVWYVTACVFGMLLHVVLYVSCMELCT